MKNEVTLNTDSNTQRLINPEQLWAIENELINIPLQYRDIFWNELLASLTNNNEAHKI